MPKQICTIEGYENISPDYYVNENGEAFSEGGTRKLKAQTNSDGYLQYGFYRTDGRQRRVAAAPLVLTAFGSPRPSADHECDHIDFNRQNDHVTNLRWVLKSEHVHSAATPLTRAQRIAASTLAIPANDPQNTLFKNLTAGISRLLRLTHRQTSSFLKRKTYRNRPASLRSGEVLIVKGDSGEASIYRHEDIPIPSVAEPKKPKTREIP